MKKLLTAFVIIFSIASLSGAAEWLAWDIPDAAQDVTGYAVALNSDPEVIVPYRLNAAADAVLGWNITDLDTAHFEIWAINSQGRRSATSAPFELKPAPSASAGHRIIQE
jgi:hypothetical protein